MSIDTTERRNGFLDGPDAPPDGPRVFLQWKGTDACFDFYCSCGARGHFDGNFAYVVRCGRCGQEWEMPSMLYPRPSTRADVAPGAIVEPEMTDAGA